MSTSSSAKIADSDLPPGCIPASRTGVYREEHFDERGDVYIRSVRAPMAQQQPRSDNVGQPQQMQ